MMNVCLGIICYIILLMLVMPMNELMFVNAWNLKSYFFQHSLLVAFYNYLSRTIAIITPKKIRLTANISFDPPCIYSS